MSLAYVKAYRLVAQLQARLASSRPVTLWCRGTTLEGDPSIGVELPTDLFENINEGNVRQVEAVLRYAHEQLVALLKESTR